MEQPVITGFAALEITKDQDFKRDFVSSFDIANYSDSWLRMIVSDVVTPIPPYNNVTQMPGQWNTGGDFTLSKINIRLEFETPVKNGNAIIYYRSKTC